MSTNCRRITKTVTTAADGTATAYVDVDFGLLSHIVYVKNNYAVGVDFTITLEATGETLWTQSNVDASAVVAPRQATHSTAGVASLYAAAGTAVNDMIAIAGDRIKIVLAQGGNATTGTFHFVLR